MSEPSNDPEQLDAAPPDRMDQGTVLKSAGPGSYQRAIIASDSLDLIASDHAHAPLLRLLAQPPDVVIDQLCEGKPWDLASDCDDHVALNAYFIEPGRVAARAIAMLATLSYAGEPADPKLLRQLADAVDTIIPEATADVIEEGPLERTFERSPSAGREASRCSLITAIGRTLGIDDTAAHSLIGTLNSLDYDDRHVFFHCIVRSMTPEAYARRFHEDSRVVLVMLRNLAKLAIDERSP